MMKKHGTLRSAQLGPLFLDLNAISLPTIMHAVRDVMSLISSNGRHGGMVSGWKEEGEIAPETEQRGRSCRIHEHASKRPSNGDISMGDVRAMNNR